MYLPGRLVDRLIVLPGFAPHGVSPPPRPPTPPMRSDRASRLRASQCKSSTPPPNSSDAVRRVNLLSSTELKDC
ncbi:hypothetical protein GE21DRAFT_1224423 [Neurospora crassa]|nr:hypothetical protein GE21DRAFT_1224423 [Neurospora crassa]